MELNRKNKIMAGCRDLEGREDLMKYAMQRTHRNFSLHHYVQLQCCQVQIGMLL